MDDLVRWLGEQLDEDERTARAAKRQRGDGKWRAEEDARGILEVVGQAEPGGVGEPVVLQPDDDETAVFVAAHDPSRVLREVGATRQIVEECARTLEGDHGYWFATFVLRREGLRFSHRPGYREEWRP